MGGRVVALLVAVPAVVGAIGLSAIEAGRFLGPAPRYRDAPAGTFADAIRSRSVEQAYAFVRAGADPNAPLAFRDPELTGDREVSVSPIMLAVAVNHDNAVMMLLSFGGRMDLPANRDAACLATRLGYEQVAAMIVRDGGPGTTTDCPETSPSTASSTPPLLAFVE